MTTARITLTLATLLLALTACGGGGDDDKAAQSISDSIMKQQKGSGAQSVFAMKRGEADCIGKGLVDKIGTDQLQEYGFLTEDLKPAESMGDVKMSADDAKAASDTLFDCADVKQMVSKAMGDVDATTKACLDKVMTEDALRGMFTKMFNGKSEAAAQELVAPMMKCTTGGQ